jgi:hypothetical protein
MKSRLRFEPLEPRETPAAFGTPWPDGENLTLSFAPDGTPVAGAPSNLAAAWGAAGPEARLAVLRAFQTWAVHANLNFGLVGDTGAAFGTGGAVQGDARFGDVRVGGIPLNPDVLAVTAPYSLYDNYSGNVVLNTAAGGYDLYTAMLQEAGHALGIDNSPDVGSVMYEFYRGARAGLSSADVAAVQALYGPRAPDRYEGANGNDTRATATGFLNPVTADITTTADVDVYRVTAGLLTRTLEVDLTAAGLSLFTGRVELLDATGAVLASRTATDPTNNDLSFTFAGVQPLRTYYVRVSSATSGVFGVGSYELSVTQNSVVTALAGAVNWLLNETGLNDTLATATALLSSTPTVGPRTEYSTDARFGSASDVDYYQLVVPPSPGGPVNLIATAWGQGGAVLNPWVEVRDAFGNRVPADVLTADGNTTTVQVRGVTPGGTYYLRVSSDSGATGGYHLSADLTATPSVPQMGAAGTLAAATAQTTGVLNVPMTGLVRFALAADGGPAELTVTAENGAVVSTLTVAAGRGRSVDLLLAAGRYRVTVRKTGAADTAFKLFVHGTTDPVGPRRTDPTATPSSGSGTTSGTSSGGATSGGTTSGSTTTTTADTQPSWYVPPSSSDNATWY